MLMVNVKRGMRLRFRDVNNLKCDGLIHVGEGVVNGDPMGLPDGGFMVPVWAERQGGREPTTIWVHWSNILEG